MISSSGFLIKLLQDCNMEMSEKKKHMVSILNRRLRYQTESKLDEVKRFQNETLVRRLNLLTEALSNSERTQEEKLFDIKDTLEYLASDFAKLSEEVTSYTKEYRSCVGLINALEYYEAHPEKINE